MKAEILHLGVGKLWGWPIGVDGCGPRHLKQKQNSSVSNYILYRFIMVYLDPLLFHDSTAKVSVHQLVLN